MDNTIYVVLGIVAIAAIVWATRTRKTPIIEVTPTPGTTPTPTPITPPECRKVTYFGSSNVVVEYIACDGSTKTATLSKGKSILVKNGIDGITDTGGADGDLVDMY